MKNELWFIFGSSCALALSGCTNPPLMFSSAEVVGVNVSASTASTNPIDLTIGYKSIDATLVPVGTSDVKNYQPIRACSNGSMGSGRIENCSSVVPAAQANSLSQKASSPGMTPVVGLQNAMANSVVPVPPNAPDGAYDQTSSANDALSVYSSFNTKAKAGVTPDTQGGGQGSNLGASAGLSLGKVFATGVAAQNLSQGQGAALNYEGQAQIYSTSLCIQNLTTALGAGKVTSSDIAICNKVAPPNTPAPVAQSGNGDTQ